MKLSPDYLCQSGEDTQCARIVDLVSARPIAHACPVADMADEKICLLFGSVQPISLRTLV